MTKVIAFVKLRDVIGEEQQYDGRLMEITIVANSQKIHFFFAQQAEHYERGKKAFWALLDQQISALPRGFRCYWFRKRASHLETSYSGITSQIDVVYLRLRDLKTVSNVIPYETVAPRHRFLVSVFSIEPPEHLHQEGNGSKRIKVWQ